MLGVSRVSPVNVRRVRLVTVNTHRVRLAMENVRHARTVMVSAHRVRPVMESARLAHLVTVNVRLAHLVTVNAHRVRPVMVNTHLVRPVMVSARTQKAVGRLKQRSTKPTPTRVARSLRKNSARPCKVCRVRLGSVRRKKATAVGGNARVRRRRTDEDVTAAVCAADRFSVSANAVGASNHHGVRVWCVRCLALPPEDLRITTAAIRVIASQAEGGSEQR
jgi:hypothetical protein